MKRFLTLASALSLGAVTYVAAGERGTSRGGYSYAAEIEKQRRNANVAAADEAYWRGKALADNGQWGGAVDEFRLALDSLPSGPFTKERKAIYTDAFSTASLNFARERAQEGFKEDAMSHVQAVLSLDPTNGEARELLDQLSDPDYYPDGFDRRHLRKVERVKELLREGKGLASIGRFDDATESYKEVLRIDRYNNAARLGMEKILHLTREYREAARSQARAEAIREVDEKWDLRVPPRSGRVTRPEDGQVATTTGVDNISSKLKSFQIPAVSFTNVTIDEVRQLLRDWSVELDPTGQGISFIVDNAGGTTNTEPITLNLRAVPMIEVLRYATSLAGMKFRIENFAVVIVPISDSGAQMYQKAFRVPPYFLTMDTGGDGQESDDPFADSSSDDGGLKAKATALDILKSKGIPFDGEASAFFNSATSQLVVRNTQQNMELVEAFVDSLQASSPKQVEVRVRFVEIRQENTDELGFDWLLGGYAFGLGSNDALSVAGGTAGNSAGVFDASRFPFAGELGANAVPGQPAPGLGNNPVSGGLRSGNMSIRGNALDALLLGRRGAEASPAPAPGIFSVGGVLSRPQFQMVLRALSQKKGIDLLTAPMVTTKSGNEAKVEVVREIIYPTEYDPPELPQTAAAGDSGGFPVTPANPTAFEMRATGVTLEVSPTVGPDGYTIDLNLAPEVVEFEGFVNYGSPITSGAVDALGNPVTIVLTDNRIDMPVFATRKATTNITIWDGQTVGIGGLIREDVQHTQDKVPLLGDIPYLGRLFRSESEQHLKRNLTIFVTTRLMDASGQEVRRESETAIDDSSL